MGLINRARVAGAVVALAVAAGCATTAPPAPQGPVDALLTLSPGQTAAVASAPVRVRFDGVKNDSRCPADAACIQAGEAIVAITVVASDRRQAYELRAPGATPVVHDGLTIAVERLDPPPAGSRPIRPADYRLTLRVRK
jgi:hypothetical protein